MKTATEVNGMLKNPYIAASNAMVTKKAFFMFDCFSCIIGWDCMIGADLV